MAPRCGQDREDFCEGQFRKDKEGERRRWPPGTRVSTILPQKFHREVVLWSTLSHPNVLGLVGVQEDIGKRQLIAVSELMVHGEIMKYISENRANRLELVRDFAIAHLAASFAKIR